MDTISDNALMQKVKEGEVEKMGLLFTRYQQQLFRFIFNMTRQKELSEDMVQNVFFRMMKYPDGFRGSGEFRTWMYHIARNVLYDHFRKEKRSPRRDEPGNYEEKVSPDVQPDGYLEKKQELEQLQKAMENLSVENRELLVMCRFQELNYNEIAAILDTTEGAVKVRVHRALTRLKENFLTIAK